MFSASFLVTVTSLINHYIHVSQFIYFLYEDEYLVIYKNFGFNFPTFKKYDQR